MSNEYWSHYTGEPVWVSTLTGNVQDSPFSLEFYWMAVDVGTTDFYTGTARADDINVALRDQLCQALQPILTSNTKMTRWLTFNVANFGQWDELNFVTSGDVSSSEEMAVWNCYQYQYTPVFYGVHKGMKSIPGVPESFIAGRTVLGSLNDPNSPISKVTAVAQNLHRVTDVNNGEYDLLATVMRRRLFNVEVQPGVFKDVYRPFNGLKTLSCTFNKYAHNVGRK